jgi:GGDEF domain-containing protein
MSDLSNIVHNSVWPYLLEVHRRLKVSIEVVDESLTPLLSSHGDRSLLDAGRAFDRIDDTLKEAIQRSMQSLQPEVVRGDPAPAVCAPVTGRVGVGVGAVLVTSTVVPRTSDREAVAKLVRIGTWLAGAVSRQLNASARMDTSELDRFSSLYRLLKQAASGGSERDVLRAFVEALAVWQDAESWAYVGDLKGRFVLDVSLPGSDRTSVPAVIEGDRFAADASAPHLSPVDLEGMGFRSDAILARVRSQSSSEWLVVICDSIDPSSQARIAIYAEAVGQILGEMTAVQSTRLTWAQLQHLLSGAERPEAAARGAIEELATAVDGRACLIVARLDGARVLTIGDAAELSSLPVPMRTSEVMTLPIDLPAPYRAVIGVIRERLPPLTRRDELLVLSTASTLGAWLPGAAPRLPIEADRRMGRRSFDQIIEQHAKAVMASGQPVSIIVISLGPDAAHLDSAAQACVAHVRSLLRPNDMAGRLSSGHICVILPDTPEDGASVVAERVHRLIVSNVDFGSFPHASLAIASRSPDAATPSPLSLIVEAWTKMGAKDPPDRTLGPRGAMLAN